MADPPSHVSVHDADIQIEHAGSLVGLTTTAPLPRECSNLPHLPVELWEMIYKHALRDAGLLSTPRPYLPAICCFSKVEYSLAAKMLVRLGGICLIDDNDAASWKTRLGGPAGIPEEMIHTAEVRYSSDRRQAGFAQDFRYLGGFSKLSQPTITVPYSERKSLWEHRQGKLPLSEASLYCDYFCTASDSIQAFGPQELTALKMLQRVVFRISNGRLGESDATAMTNIAHQIALQIRTNFVLHFNINVPQESTCFQGVLEHAAEDGSLATTPIGDLMSLSLILAKSAGRIKKDQSRARVG